MRRLASSLPAVALLVVACRASAAAPVPAVNPDDEKLLRAARAGTDGPALLDYFRRRTLTPAQRARIRVLIPQLGDDSFRRRQQASLELMTFGPAALAHLRAALDDPDEEIKERLRACIGGLEKGSTPAVGAAAARLVRARAPAGALDVMLAHLPDADTDAVEDEVLAALAVLGVEGGKVAPALVRALDDRDAGRRAGAALVVGRSGSRDQRARVQALLTDASPVVRFQAARGLLAARDRSGIPVLIALVGDGPPRLAAAADELLGCLAGASAPRVVPGEDAASRRRCRALWAAWWRGHARMDLSRADVDLPAFNGTLRAGRVARQFVQALLQGDAETAQKVVEAPFLFGGERVFAKAADLEKAMGGPLLLMLGGRDSGQPYSVAAVRSLDNAVRTVSPAERGFLARFRRGELRVVEVLLRPPGPNPTESAVVLVRLSGDQAHVVGFRPTAAGPIKEKD
jgi:hypothetical protein